MLTRDTYAKFFPDSTVRDLRQELESGVHLGDHQGMARVQCGRVRDKLSIFLLVLSLGVAALALFLLLSHLHTGHRPQCTAFNLPVATSFRTHLVLS